MRKRSSAREQKTGERLQKVLARAGFGSRREIEGWIEQGRVILNGKPAQLGDQYKSGDKLKVNGKLVSSSKLHAKAAKIVMYHKPVGIVCTRSDPEGRKTVFDELPNIHNGRWVTVGRLDISTSGLLLATTDGTLANRLMHPSSEIEREYAVRVLGEVDNAMLQRLSKGVELEDGIAKFDSIQKGGGTGANQWYNVVLKEGRNREVRRLWESQGVTVSRLARIRYGNIKLPKGLRPGKFRDLTELETRSLRSLLSKQTDKETETLEAPATGRKRFAPKNTPRKKIRARK